MSKKSSATVFVRQLDIIQRWVNKPSTLEWLALSNKSKISADWE